MQLADKVILLVGALDDLAASVGLRLAQQGASLVYAGADANKGQALLEKIEAVGGEVSFTKTRPDSESDAQSMVGEAIVTFGGLDGLVILPDRATSGAASELEQEAWEDKVERSLRSAWLATKFAMPFLRRGSDASVVLLMRQEALHCGPAATLDAVTQAGLHGLCRSLAVDYGPAGIRVNGLVVGTLEDAELHSRLGAEEHAQGALARLTSRIPLGRIGSPQEVAPAVSFLLSRDASWISGSILHIDGGASASGGSFAQ